MAPTLCFPPLRQVAVVAGAVVQAVMALLVKREALVAVAQELLQLVLLLEQETHQLQHHRKEIMAAQAQAHRGLVVAAEQVK